MKWGKRFLTALPVAVAFVSAPPPVQAQFVTPGSPLTMNSLASFLNTAFGEMQNAACISGVNFNSANTDSTIAINFSSARTRFMVEGLVIDHASTTVTTATAGLFTAAGGLGTTVSTNQALTVTGSTGGVANGLQSLSLAANTPNTFFQSTAIFFRIGTAQGAAATADVCVYYRQLP